MKQDLVYRKRGRRYEPIGVDGRQWEGLSFGDYIMSIKEGCTSIRRLPNVNLGFAEAALRELEEALAAQFSDWLRSRNGFSPAEAAEEIVACVREFFAGKEVSK